MIIRKTHSSNNNNRSGSPPREFHEPGFRHFLCGFCADSSSPRISAILVGHFSGENDSLHKSPLFSAKPSELFCADKCQNPGSQNSLGGLPLLLLLLLLLLQLFIFLILLLIYLLLLSLLLLLLSLL